MPPAPAYCPMPEAMATAQRNFCEPESTFGLRGSRMQVESIACSSSRSPLPRSIVSCSAPPLRRCRNALALLVMAFSASVMSRPCSPFLPSRSASFFSRLMRTSARALSACMRASSPMRASSIVSRCRAASSASRAAEAAASASAAAVRAAASSMRCASGMVPISSCLAERWPLHAA